MVRIYTVIKNLEDFFKKHSHDLNTINDDFLKDVKSICHGLKFLEISFKTFLSRCRLQTVIENAFHIIRIFHNMNLNKTLNNVQFNVYLKLNKAVVHLENILVANLDLNSMVLEEFSILDILQEQNTCLCYKEKLKEFKAYCSEVEVQLVNENFTYFTIEYLKLLSKFSNYKPNLLVLQKFAVQVLLEVADLKILLENFHSVSNLICESEKIPLMHKIAKQCIKKKLNIQNSSLVQSVNKDFRLETCTISYYVLQYICKQLELKKIYQTSRMLSKFNVENIIILSDAVASDAKFEKLYDESFITFKKNQKIRVVPSSKIDRCLYILQILLDSFSDRQPQNCPFALILLSMLSEFVMATNFDNTTIISLIDLIIGYLEFCKLPLNFNAISYALKIYQKFKSNNVLELKLIDLCKSLSKNLDLTKRKQHIEENLEFMEDIVEKSLIISYFLKDVEELCKSKDTDVNNLFNTFNVLVLFSSYNTSTIDPRLVFPYSVSLNFSLISKNEECLFNNLALLEDFTTLILDDNQDIESADKIHFLKLVLRNYEDIAQCLPNKFLIKCWNYVLNSKDMDLTISKTLLQLCSSKTLMQFINDLKTETMRLIKENLPEGHEEYYHHIDLLWSVLLNMQLIKQKKKIRKDLVNHFTFVLNKTFLFHSNIIKSEQGLILLLKLICSYLKVSWINTSSLVYCALRIITYIEKSSNLSDVELLIEAAELLIVLYKYPHSTTKSVLGLYLTSFSNILKKCWFFTYNFINTDNLIETDSELKKQRQLYIPFHKLEKCSSLFKAHKSDFEIICRYIIVDQVELIWLNPPLPDGFMRHYYNIIFNLMDVCSTEEMKLLMMNIHGPTLKILQNAFDDYRSKVMFTGRL